MVLPGPLTSVKTPEGSVVYEKQSQTGQLDEQASV